MPARLSGIRVVSFFPWKAFEPSGASSRFSSLWRFLLHEDAQVSLAFFEDKTSHRLAHLSVHYFGHDTVFSNASLLAQALSAEQAKPDQGKFSRIELLFLLLYKKEIHLAQPALAPWLDELIAAHDVVTCEYPMYAPLLSEFCRKHHKPLIVTSHDLLFELHGSSAKSRQLLKQHELHALGLADALVFCNDGERSAAAAHGLKGVTVMNTGDALSLTPGAEAENREAIRAKLKLKTAHYCLFVGSAHGPNVEAVTEIKRMAKAMPELTFVLAGECHAKAEEANFVALGLITPALLDSLYRGALAVLLPLARGGGMSVNLFEASIYAKPVVSTPVGARGHDVKHERELLLVPTAAQFPAALRRLLADEPLRVALGQRARAYAEPLDFRNHFQPYAEIILNLLHRPNAPSPSPTTSAPALVLADNNLSDHVGHHFNYARVLATHATRQGFGWRALVKKSATSDVLAELSAHATFTQGIHEDSPLNPYPAEWGMLRATYDFLLANDHFAQELAAGLAHAARIGDLIFLPNATPRQLIGLALLLKKHPLFLELRYVLVLRFSVFVATGPLADRKPVLDKDTAEKYNMAINLIGSVDTVGAVRFATDSAELAKEYANFTKRTIEVLPIPHTASQSSTPPPPDVPAKKPGVLRVVFLGDAREEKGFELLPAVVHACAQNPALPPVEFVFQTFISSHWHARMQAVIDQLDQLHLPNVHLLRTALSPETYEAVLHSADLVLIPYDAITYRARTSGPFIEALCAEKPVVAPKNSWMAQQLGTSAAGVTFATGQAADLVHAVQAVLQNLPAHAAAARELGREFRAFHNPENFLQHLMARRPATATRSPLPA